MHARCAWKLSEGVGHTHNSPAVHVGAQPAMGGGNHRRLQYRLILDSVLRSQDWEEGRTTTGGNGGKSHATRGTKIRYEWQGNSMMFLLKLQQRFITVVKVQPGLATAHVKLLTHVLSLLNHALGAHRPSRHSEMPSSLLRAIKLWYIVPALLHSQDSRVKRR